MAGGFFGGWGGRIVIGGIFIGIWIWGFFMGVLLEFLGEIFVLRVWGVLFFFTFFLR